MKLIKEKEIKRISPIGNIEIIFLVDKCSPHITFLGKYIP